VGAALAWHHWFWLEVDPCLAQVDEVIRLSRRTGELWRLSEALSLAGLARILQGDLAAARRLADEAHELGGRIGNPGEEFVGGRVLFMLALAAGRFDEATRLVRRDAELGEQTGFGWTFDTAAMQATVQMWLGDLDAARAACDRGDAGEVPCPFSGVPWGFGVLADALRGDRARVVAIADQKMEGLPAPDSPILIGLRCAYGCLAEALARVGDSERALRLYAHLLDGLDRAPLRGYDLRIVETVAGMVMSCAGEWDAAQAHFEASLRRADSVGHLTDGAECRRAYAQMLLARGRPQDRESARRLLDEAVGTFRGVGAVGYLRPAEELGRSL
jgi:tetratricopeptide (TPR) repeat protein